MDPTLIKRFLAYAAILAGCASALGEPERLFQVGAAKVDVTPSYPIRLSGYGNRRTESEGVAEHLWTKALAIGSDADGPAILVTVDNCGVSDRLADEVAERLKKKAGLPRERFTLCSTHNHTGPCLTGVLPNLFSQDISKDEQATIDRYTRELTDRIEQVSLAALANRRACHLAWGQGTVTFAQNRRTKNGPVDHALPILRATDTDGNVRAIWASYACHCTTLFGEFNQVHGDWAGRAQEGIERDHPGAVALISVGCGADSNPQPRGTVENAIQNGEDAAREVRRLVSNSLTPIRGNLECRTKRIELTFQEPFSRQQWEERSKKSGIVGYHAKLNLARLDRGESLPKTLPYRVQTWSFGNELAIVFLAGEVVVDYSLRLKNEFDPSRLWVTGYANGVPCYIPSQRILREGGYEAEESLWYYDRPGRLVLETENLIDRTVHDLMPNAFLFDQKKAEFPPPKSPEDSLRCLQTRTGLKIELVAAEPLVVDPVAIDFGPDGKLWVVEMRDFPMGMDGNWKPGGRVKFLEDLDGDSKYDRATVFLDDVPFPTGVTAWKNGALICAAPDILYAEDTNGDGRADRVQKLFTGFATQNYQARVNGLSLGLDNWIYGANGLIGGVIRRTDRIGSDTPEISAEEINIRGRDFRMNPETGAFETASGLSQQGRVRDDWGDWFGCDNSNLLWHYPLPENYVRRNPDVPGPNSRVNVPTGADPNQLFPISRTLRRFNDPQHANRVTSACGLGIYRDKILGTNFYNNAFVCEPVHNLVHRLVLSENGVTFSAERAPDEAHMEFLASTDNWFRPVQVRTGPDGALWVVDMYRFVVEHPRWITPDRLKELDLRAGDDKGRIYRIYPRGTTLDPIRDLTKLSVRELAKGIDNPNGTERDRVHQELLRRRESSAGETLRKIARSSLRAACRVQALAALDGLKIAMVPDIVNAMRDTSPEVRSQAIRMAEKSFGKSPIQNEVFALLADPSIRVRYQLALSLGESRDPRAAGALAQLLIRDRNDLWIRAAVLSSSIHDATAILKTVLAAPESKSIPADCIGDLVATALARTEKEHVTELLALLVPAIEPARQAWEFAVTAKLFDALARQSLTLATLRSIGFQKDSEVPQRYDRIFDQARETVANANATEAVREAAIRLLGRDPTHLTSERSILMKLLGATSPSRLSQSALDAFERSQDPAMAETLISKWTLYPPSLRTAILDKLLRREKWTMALLHQIEIGTVTPSELSASQRQRLFQFPNNQAIRERANKVFEGDGARSRAAVINQFQEVFTRKGNIADGQKLFHTLCSTCHAFHGDGTAVGPNLEALTDKSVQFLLTAILDPNAAVEDRFTSYSIELRDGRSLSGLIVEETPASLVLANAGGVRETILRSQIKEIRASKISLMPEGLEANLKPQDLADLIAYVQVGPTATIQGTASATSAARPALAIPPK